MASQWRPCLAGWNTVVHHGYVAGIAQIGLSVQV